MKQILQHKGIAVMAGLSALAAAGLTTLCLLNIPSFYELDQPGKVKLFLLVLAGFAIAAFFATRWFVLPYTRSYTDRGNALLIALLGAILLAAFGGIIGLFVVTRFPQPYHPVFNVEDFQKHGSQDGFYLAIEASDPKFNLAETRTFLESLGAILVSEIEA